jgi:hypothetical protein
MGPGSFSSRVFLHHNPAYAADAEGIRGFLGETWVHQSSVMMHASGALLIAGALLAVLLLTHRMRNITDTGSALAMRARGMKWARILLVVGWAINLLGGTMRLFEPDHPSIAEIGAVAWVQVILIKHVFILGALLASLIAVEWAPRLWHRYRPRAAAIGLVFVFLSAVLGGVSSGLPVPAQSAMMNPPSLGVPSPSPGEHVVEYKNTTFQITGSPVAPAQQEFPFEVDHWAFAMTARIEWTTQSNMIDAWLVDPNGDTVARLTPSQGTTAQTHVDVNLYPGTWVLLMETSQSLMESVHASIKLERGTAQERVLEGTVHVSADGFFEINFWMDPGDHFHYHWHVPDAHGPVHWDIHTHPDGEVRYHERGEAHDGEGDFISGNEQIYSIMWLPLEDRSFTITYRVEGSFRLHSIYG